MMLLVDSILLTDQSWSEGSATIPNQPTISLVQFNQSNLVFPTTTYLYHPHQSNRVFPPPTLTVPTFPSGTDPARFGLFPSNVLVTSYELSITAQDGAILRVRGNNPTNNDLTPVVLVIYEHVVHKFAFDKSTECVSSWVGLYWNCWAVLITSNGYHPT